MSYSFSIKGKFKVEPELAKDVARMLKEADIDFDRPKKSIFVLDDDMAVEEAELTVIIDVFEHIFDFIEKDLDQSIFIFIHELDPVDREVIINEKDIDLMTKNDSTSHLIFLEKGIMKNTKKVLDNINSYKDDIVEYLKEKDITSKWVELNVNNNPYILPTLYKLKIKGGNKGIFITALLDEDLECENNEEFYQYKDNEEIKKKFKEGYIGIRIALRAYSNEIEEKAANEVFNFLKEKFEYYHTVKNL